jgi:hypothetical protein
MYLATMFDEPVGGAEENVRVVPTTLYAVGSCNTPDIETRTADVVFGATDIVNAVVELFPLK